MKDQYLDILVDRRISVPLYPITDPSESAGPTRPRVLGYLWQRPSLIPDADASRNGDNPNNLLIISDLPQSCKASSQRPENASETRSLARNESK